MHGSYITPGLERNVYKGPAQFYRNGLTFSVVDQNSPVPKFVTRVTEADFDRFVRPKATEAIRLDHIPAVTVESVRWWHAGLNKQWVGELTTREADAFLADGSATLEPIGDLAGDAWAA
jgi:hypothetical protein